jgi:hypothetical protein
MRRALYRLEKAHGAHCMGTTAGLEVLEKRTIIAPSCN